MGVSPRRRVAVGFQAETCKLRGPVLQGQAVRKYSGASEPTQFFGLLANQSADVTPFDQDSTCQMAAACRERKTPAGGSIWEKKKCNNLV